MGTKKILRNTGLLAAASVVALALAAVPVTPDQDAGFAGLKSAQAKGNGGSDNGGGHGNSGNAGNGGGTASAGAGGQGNGNGKPDGSGPTTAGGHGINATTAGQLKGNLNAYHASVMAFKNAAPNSMVGQISAAITENELEVDQKAALDTLSNQPVDEDVLEAVRGIVSDKVEAAAEITAETEESEETEPDET